MRHHLWGRLAVGMGIAAVASCVGRTEAEEAESPRIIRFRAGEWDTASWRAVRMVNQEEPRTFRQTPDGIAVAKDSFRQDDYGKERDNALLVTDTGTTDGEVEVTYRFGEGFNGNSSPGIVVSPVIVNGVLEKGIGVFVADYALAVWLVDCDPTKSKVTYAHMGQLARRTDPSRPHTLRCRYSLPERSIAIQIDDSDVLVFQFVGNAHLSKVDVTINSLVGLWGCHGVSEFQVMAIRRKGTLPFLVRTPPKAP